MKIQQAQRRAIVIGASSGIGQRLARLLLHDGWFLGVAARRDAPLEQLAKDFPGQVVWNSIDVTDAKAAEGLEQLVKKAGGMDLFLYASGVGKMNPNLDPEPEELTLNTNALGFYENGGGCLPLFRSAGAWPHCRDLVDCRYPWAGTVAILLSYKSASKYLYRSAGATEPRTRNKHSVH